MDDQQSKIRMPLPGYRSYLITILGFGVILIFLVFCPNLNRTIPERIACCILLAHLIINVNGILQSKTWLYLSEMIRITIAFLALIQFAGLSEKPWWLTLSVIYHIYCYLGTIWFYRPISDY